MTDLRDLETRPIAFVPDERPAPPAVPPEAAPQPAPALAHRSGFSVRARLTAAVALAVLMALALAGVIVYAIEYQRIEDQMLAQSSQEFAELRALQADTAEIGTPDPSVADLLDTFLERNVPQDNEVLVSWYEDWPQYSSPTGTKDFAGSPFFEQTVRPLLADNGTATVQVPEYGEAMFAVQSVAGGPDGPDGTDGTDTGALVVVSYLEEARAGLHETMRTYAITAALSLLLVTAFAAWLSGRLLSPLRTLRTTAAAIGDSDLSRRLPVRGNDDITALTRTVNGMLDRLEDAFVGQRQFLDDAGHELRTPLTVLRGHLELLDVGSPAEVAETRELLLDETDRMARLVNDLILLAKSDRPDFVTTAPTDVAGLTADVLAKARGLGERTWTLDALADVSAPLDAQRLTQALLQLCDNAVKHTRPGDVVALGSSYDDGGLELWVRDTGPGVPAEDRELVFRRFGRSRLSDADEGFGLGLSIVTAIATAHGGTARVEDAVPHGARFVVSLPLPGPSALRVPVEDDRAWPVS